jgi:hypothetical protein
VDADAHGEIVNVAGQIAGVGRHGGLNVQGSVHGPHRMVLVGYRRAEEGQHPIAQQLGNGALIADDGIAHAAMGAGDNLAPFLGV